MRTKPFRVKDGWLYWDFHVRAVKQKDGKFKMRLRLNRSRIQATDVFEFPVPGLMHLLVRCSKRLGTITKEEHRVPKTWPRR